MSKKPTIHELGADIVTLLDSIGNLNNLPQDIKRSTLVEVISVVKALVDGATTGEGVVLSSLSQLTNDVGFITAAQVPPNPTKLSELTNDSNFVTSTHNHNGTYEPVLAAENKRKITFGTAAPVTLAEGEIYLQYE
jgi:hypothetical protein